MPLTNDDRRISYWVRVPNDYTTSTCVLLVDCYNDLCDEIHTDGRVYTDLNDVTGYYLDDVVGETGEQVIETVVGETGEQVIETEDDDEEQVIETENDDEDSENELPMLVEQEDESVVPGHVVTRDTAEDYYGDYPAIWYRATKIAKVPRSYQQAMVYDNENENTLWMDAIRKEMKKMEALFGNEFQFYSYTHEVQDSNLYHDMLSGKAVTAILHMLNQTPIDWYSKKQNTVETATFGSENVAARTAIEQMKDLKFTLLYLGVPIVDRSIMVGDNKTVVDCATQPHYKLVKRHLMLSYHYVREAMATGNYGYVWLNGKDNPADILSKHWAYGTVWKLLQPLLFWQGDTNDCPSKMTDLTSG